MSIVGSDAPVPPELGLVAAEPEDWIEALTSPGPRQDHAMERLHTLLLRAARHQVWRMRSSLGGAGHARLDEIANQAADEAMMTVLAKLHTFEGRSRFTTWAYKFAILQSATEVRRLAWQHREVSLDELAEVPSRGPSPAGYTEGVDLAWAVRSAIDTALTPHQRRVTVALLVDEVPIDVLAERLGTNRNALYKTVHDARARLRADLVSSGHLSAQIPREPRHE